MSIEFVLRLIGMVVLAIAGWQFGLDLAQRAGLRPTKYVMLFFFHYLAQHWAFCSRHG